MFILYVIKNNFAIRYKKIHFRVDKLFKMTYTLHMLFNTTFFGGDLMDELRKLREEKGMTQEQLANILGVNRTTVTLWEVGINKPRADMLIKLADVLQCPIDVLLRSNK